MTQMTPDDQPDPELHPADAAPGSAGRAKAGAGSAWKTPAIAAGAAFVAVRLLRIGLAGKLLKAGFRLGRGPGGKLALSFAAKKLAGRRRS